MIPYTTFIKHATKVTRSVSDARPILRGVYHRADDGALIVTDSYRLYVAYHAYAGGEDRVIDPVTGAELEGVYPDTSKLIPQEPKATFKLTHIGMLTKIAKAMAELARYPVVLSNDEVERKSDALFDIRSVAGSICLSTHFGHVSANTAIANTTGTKINLVINAGYIVDALQLFHDVGYNVANVEYNGDTHPIVLRGSDLLVLIMPTWTL